MEKTFSESQTFASNKSTYLQMEMDDNTYEENHREILKRLNELFALMKAKNRLNGETIYDNQDLCMMLRLSKRSLQRLRSTGVLPYLQIGQKTFYIESDVLKYVQDQIDKKKTLGSENEEEESDENK